MCLNPYLSYKIGEKVIPLKEIQEKYNPKIYENIQSQNLVIIKCGECKECLKEKLLEIKQRIKNEYMKNEKCYFLTLTYDNENVKKLNKRDIQLFLKRYRKKYKIRYFYAGELGEKNQRPHYHMIIFGHIPDDLTECSTKTKNNYKQYDSELISKLWGQGIIKISKMELPLIGYITKYMMKNVSHETFIYGWSKNPPIGINEDNIEERINNIHCSRAEKQYYKNHFDNELPKNEYLEEKNKIKIEEIEKQTNQSYLNYIKQKRNYK